MTTNRVFRAVTLGIALSALCGAGVIADLVSDFQPVAFPPGWQYLRNTGPIGTSANYVQLLWDVGSDRYDVTGAGTPAVVPTGLDYTQLTSSGTTHPGQGIAQGAPENRYFIAAYTVQAGENGLVSVSGTLTGLDRSGAGGNSNGWDIRVFVGDTQAGGTQIFPWSTSAGPFAQALGLLDVGDEIYVALGPNGSHLFDSARLSLQLTSSTIPEPTTILTCALGMALLAIHGLRRQQSKLN